MGTSYNHLSAAERTTLMVMVAEGLRPSTVARHLGRSRSTISRELGRNPYLVPAIDKNPDDAIVADDRARSLRAAPGLNPKLGVDTPLFGVVQDQLREGWSPEQIAGRLEEAFPDDSTRTVSHETIYTAIYVLPRGSLRTDLYLVTAPRPRQASPARAWPGPAWPDRRHGQPARAATRDRGPRDPRSLGGRFDQGRAQSILRRHAGW